MPGNLGFNNTSLRQIPAHLFARTYNSIIMIDSGRHLSEACGGKIYETFAGSQADTVIKFPNPWRKIANGRVMRDFPISLYLDDTSGNVSKQFNKHISFYFTLAGLLPQISNQEYHCHFLATSNLASACEMLENIVEELNFMGPEGFMAYDHGLSSPVLVRSLVFCFLANSSMHAKIMNTPIPGNCLNPCQMCTLLVRMKKFKKTRTFIQNFLQSDRDGRKRAVQGRDWETTRVHTHELFNIAQTVSLNQSIIKSKEYGVKDAITSKLLAKAKDDPSIQKKISDWANNENSSKRLYNPILELEGQLCNGSITCFI
ncbi:hypothetical protein PTTG_02044 [Puccinia triticina 1-1 BBBD Race 1]|uniref:Uncharacterized protein n=1 Tax=Puccinia triticina (isolate 1-1 / race 1 (BBBD)) TaxID=630390 RepID=A0A180GK03_PUCT1|nr:hypothetical protein PTTG_02044 [Puccinia triticina 1-1 BBBD Race 1]